MYKVSEKVLIFFVYSRRKRSVVFEGIEEYNLGKCKKWDDLFDDFIVLVYNFGESLKR